MLENEAENVRTSIINAMQRIKSFSEEVGESARKVGSVIQQIEGGVQVVEQEDGGTITQHVSGVIVFGLPER